MILLYVLDFFRILWYCYSGIFPKAQYTIARSYNVYSKAHAHIQRIRNKKVRRKTERNEKGFNHSAHCPAARQPWL